ncbi:MAG TPA: biotin/lipoyl-containing protein [Thermoanaerobaculia bacterium]|nr:biotin/lipoyl-containing protein [Thermoanaerobaculia bacterium]
MKIVTIGGQQTEVDPRSAGIEIVAVRADEMELRVGDRIHVVPYAVQGSTVSFSYDGEIYFAEVADKGVRAKARHRDASMSAPMPGLVLKILVREGDVVAKGAPLLILEAMKMEHQIVAPRDGEVAAIHCREGELVQGGVELVSLKEQHQEP